MHDDQVHEGPRRSDDLNEGLKKCFTGSYDAQYQENRWNILIFHKYSIIIYLSEVEFNPDIIWLYKNMARPSTAGVFLVQIAMKHHFQRITLNILLKVTQIPILKV